MEPKCPKWNYSYGLYTDARAACETLSVFTLRLEKSCFSLPLLLCLPTSSEPSFCQTFLASNWTTSLNCNSMAIGKITLVTTVTIWNHILGKKIFYWMRRKGVLSGLKKSKRYKLLQVSLRFLSFILGSKGAEQYKKNPQNFWVSFNPQQLPEGQSCLLCAFLIGCFW